MQKMNSRVCVNAAIHKSKAMRWLECRIGAFLDDSDGSRRQPASGNRRGERLFAEPLAIRRIGEDELERTQGADGAELGRIAAVDFRCAHRAERFDVAPDQPARLSVLLDEMHIGGAAREGLQAERAGSGEKVEHTGAFDLEAVRRHGQEC